MLKPQDVVVLLKLAVVGEDWSYPSLASALGISASEVHSAVRRANESGLINLSAKHLNRPALIEFLTHGLRYAFPAKRGGVTRGLPTAYAAPPLKNRISAGGDLVPVWPDPEGDVRGEELSPLYKSVPGAARRDPALYELLALVDAVRSGRARERTIAIEELRSRLT